jgi:PEP-CTERM motif
MKLVTRISMLTLLALATIFVSAAKADTVTTYDVTGTFASGGTLSGTFTLDNLTVYSANIVADGQTLTCTGGSPCYTSTSGSYDVLNIPTGSYPFVQLDWLPFNYSAPPTTFALSTTSYCESCGTSSYVDYLTIGSAFTPGSGPTPTPEPSSVLLMVSGLVGLAFLATRRRANASIAA